MEGAGYRAHRIPPPGKNHNQASIYDNMRNLNFDCLYEYTYNTFKNVEKKRKRENAMVFTRNIPYLEKRACD